MKRELKRYLLKVCQVIGLCIVILVLGKYILSFYIGLIRIDSSSHLMIDKKNKRIQFKGVINRDSGWIQLLIYAHSEKWLKKIPGLKEYSQNIAQILAKNCAIKTDIELTRLQKAILDLGIEYWQPYNIIIEYKKKNKKYTIPILELVKDGYYNGNKIPLEKLIFLGFGLSKAYNNQVFVGNLSELIKSWFLRQSGNSGFILNQEIIPKKGTKVSIYIYYE